VLAFATALAATLGPAAPARAILTGLPPGFLDELVVGNLPFPTAVAFTPDGRLLVALKRGEVRMYQGTTLLSTFIDIRGEVHDNHDRGLLGLAVHPDFPQTPYVYLLYTHDPPGAPADGIPPGTPPPTSVPARVSQLLRVEADPATSYTTAKATNRVVLLGTNSTLANIGSLHDGRNTAFASCMSPQTWEGTPVEDCIPSDEDSHSIGTVAFAPDGSLFVSSGDGSNYGGVDPRAQRARNRDSLAGKVLRIDPITGLGLPDNPFYQPASPNSNRSKVWASGLRNPFRLAIHPTTSAPWIGDVGWNAWEEIDTGKGAHFGWPCYEGGAAGSPPPPESGVTTSRRQSGYESNVVTAESCQTLYAQGVGAVKAPTFAYDHSPGGASANAGAFYGGTTYPAVYQGALFIADYNLRWIRFLTFDGLGVATAYPFGVASTGPVQVLQGPDTNLYWVQYSGSGGELRRVRYVGGGNVPPVVLIDATPTIGLTPLAVQFDSNATYDPDAQPLSFAWDFGDGGSSTARNPAHLYTLPGVYDAELTVTELTAPFASASETVRITVGNSPPLATIEAPANGSTYRVNDVIDFSATATSGGNPVPAAQLEWELRTIHNQHAHFDAMPAAPDPLDEFRSIGQFTVSDHGDQVSLQLCVTVTVESEIDTQCVDLEPEKTEVSLATDPVGLAISYEDEGLELSGPALIYPVVGSEQTISVLPVQQHRSFVGWDDGESERSRTFVVGTTPLTFAALYENRPPSAIASPPAAGGPAPVTIQLDASLSSDPEGDALQVLWDAEALGTSQDPTPSFTFLVPGSYTVTLTVTDQLGASDSATVAVEVTDYGMQTPAQRRCVRTVNRGVARVARAQAAAARRCLADAAAGRVGRLGPGGTFDACLEADVDARVARAADRVGAREPGACAAEPPELALGANRLAGVGPASLEGAALVRDLLGDPAAAAPSSERAAARCQRALVAHATGHLRSIFGATQRAVDASLRGGAGAPAVTDVELTAAVEAALATHGGLARGAERLGAALAKRCAGAGDLAAVVPGCGSGDPAALAACALGRTRCRACRLAVAADPGLALDCDAFDEGAANWSCP
jgi:glucose/arabinose dehydrogenase